MPFRFWMAYLHTKVEWRRAAHNIVSAVEGATPKRAFPIRHCCCAVAPNTKNSSMRRSISSRLTRTHTHAHTDGVLSPVGFVVSCSTVAAHCWKRAPVFYSTTRTLRRLLEPATSSFMPCTATMLSPSATSSFSLATTKALRITWSVPWKDGT